MTAKSLGAHYALLNPEERFRLIFAASSRGDEAEQSRLTSAGVSKTLCMVDHSPYALAFLELSDLMFIELLTLSADYLEGLLTIDDVRKRLGLKNREDRCPVLDLVLAQGYELNVRLKGWELFCTRQELSPFHLWQTHSGNERIKRATLTSKRFALVEEGYLCWQNARRPSDSPNLTHVGLTAEAIAGELETMYNERVNWWRDSSFSHANR